MNLHLLNPEVQQFIKDNENVDIARLILSGSPFKDITPQELAQQVEGRKKTKKKLPEWYAGNGIYFPPKVNLEQASSAATAMLKSTFVQGATLLDMTGGLGVDAYFFAKQFSSVTYCELNAALFEIARHNLKVLGAKNIDLHQGDAMNYMAQGQKYYDAIYIDPSRRSNVKGKVFMLKDCEPNVPEHMGFLLAKAKKILIKTSPILDITSALNELAHVAKVFIVALHNEVKELLFLIDPTATGLHLETYNITASGLEEFKMPYALAAAAIAELDTPKNYVYEPNAAVMKSGMFDYVGEAYGLQKLHKNSHLYTSDSCIEFPGRRFEVEEVVAFSAKAISRRLKGKKANITTRNFKLTVEQVRQKFKVKDGGDDYVFFTTDLRDKPVVLFCKKA